jgi:ketol-acid reductoisomerase
MRYSISNTAEYGDYVSGDRVVGEESRAAMKKVLQEVQSGTFARRWMEEASSGGESFHQRRSGEETHQLEAVGRDLRSRMAWL